jgi:hypothetical protein
MREIASDPVRARTIGERAAADVARLHSPAARGPLIVDILSRIPQPIDHGVTYQAPVHDEPPPPEDVLSLEALFAQVRAGAGLGSPTRFVRVSRRIRQLVSRLTWHTAEHQRRIDLAITHNINHLVTETSDLPEVRKLIEELQTRIRELDARMIKERDYRRELTEELGRLEHGGGNGPSGPSR